jgi:TPR repeat protein
VDKNNVEAFEYYSKVNSSFEKIGETYHQLGHLCVVGANNPAGSADYVTTSSYYSMGANSNNAECMLHLGEFYDTEGKLKTNFTLAKYWYKKACDLKNEKACTKLKGLE